MSDTKFFDCITDSGNKMFNVANVALVENINGKTFVTMNVNGPDGLPVRFSVPYPWEEIASDIESRAKGLK